MARDLYAAGSTECAFSGKPCGLAEVGANCASAVPGIAKMIGVELTLAPAGADGVVPAADRPCYARDLQPYYTGKIATGGAL